MRATPETRCVRVTLASFRKKCSALGPPYPRATLFPMTDKKQDATKNLDPDEPTQETEKGLKIGVPDKDEFLAGLEKVSKPEK